MIVVFDLNGRYMALASDTDPYEYSVAIGATVVEMNGVPPSPLHEPCIDGSWAIPPEVSGNAGTLVELAWREAEMPIAQQNVTAIEYGEPGDAQAWKAYWFALRKWTADNPDFPDATKRPQAPS